MKSERACCLKLFGKWWEYREHWEEEAAFTIHQARSSPTPTLHRYLWVFFIVESLINTEKAGGLEEEAGKEPTPIHETKTCQPITWVSGSQARVYRDGALGCQGSTKSEGDKGGKAFTTSAAETFAPHYKRNMAALPRLNPHQTRNVASG